MAVKEQEGMGYGYGDAATDATTTEKGPLADAHAGTVRAAKEWVATIDDACAWPSGRRTRRWQTTAKRRCKASAEEDAKKKAPDGTVGTSGLFGALAMIGDGGGGGGGSRGNAAAVLGLFGSSRKIQCNKTKQKKITKKRTSPPRTGPLLRFSPPSPFNLV